MGFFGSIISATVKTVLTPIAVVKDVANVATGQEADATKTHIEGVVEDVAEAGNDLAEGEL